MLTLILGGARSGKSRYAEQCAGASGKQVVYCATATAGDQEMQARIARHRSDRPQHWKTVEEPIRLADVLKEQSDFEHCILVDCLTLWLSNILFDDKGAVQLPFFEQHVSDLIECIDKLPGDLIMVSNEVGSGIIPLGEGTRRFVDEAGRLHQRLAQLCDKVVLVTAGLPQVLKWTG